MLGSAVANLQIIENGQIKRIAFTGDIGRPVNRILAPPKPFPQTDILVTESTYGDRLHSNNEAAEEELLSVLVETCVEKRGKLIIPAFSVGRTQEIVYTFDSFFNAGKLPRVDIYVDSPLAVNATTVFRMHTECFNEEFQQLLQNDIDPFGFKNLFYITKVEDSKKLNDHKEPCVIISASGMAEAGRIKHHLANNISDSRNTVLFVGYCSPTTLGARIQGGAKEVSIFGTVYQVNADIRKIESFSGHADYREMIGFLSCQEKSAIEKTFIVHGEYETQKKYVAELQKEGYKNIEIPAKGQEYQIL
jgi:metallo-beta-lactamase family protein